MRQKYLELIEKQTRFEAEGNFHADIVPPNEKKILPITEKHKYINRNIFYRFTSFCTRTVFWLVCFAINTFWLRLRIKGRKNLRGLKGAVLTCNHVDMFDNVMVRQAVMGHKLYVTVGYFNNRNDALGEFLRLAGALPIPNSTIPKYTTIYRNFDNAIEYYLEKKNFVLFYPEQSLWWRYEKLRPFKDGAFHYAVKNNVPIVPMYITWRKNKKGATIHIMPPVRPDENLSRKENIVNMKNANVESINRLQKNF